MLPATQFVYRKGPGTCDNLLCVLHILQNSLEMWQKARMVMIVFNVNFDRSNQLTFPTQFLAIPSKYVLVDGCCNKLVVVPGVPQGSVLGQQVFLLYAAELFSIVENKLYGYADDSTLVSDTPSLCERVVVKESMNLDLNRVSVWCDLWGMKLNASKTKII